MIPGQHKRSRANDNSAANGVYGRRGLLVRLIYLGISICSFVIGRIRHRPAGRAIVLCYHGVQADQADRFAWQVKSIADRAIATAELSSESADQRKEPSICLTFDDALSNLLANAIPVLNRHSAPATIFAVAEGAGSPPRWLAWTSHADRAIRTMTAAELRDCLATGRIRIGSHTLSHPHLSSLDDAAIRHELEESRRQLRSALNSEIDELALPHGDYDQRVLDAASAAGYARVFTLDEALVDRAADERGVFGRFLMSPDAWQVEFHLTCAGSYAWLHQWRALARRLRGMIAAGQQPPGSRALRRRGGNPEFLLSQSTSRVHDQRS